MVSSRSLALVVLHDVKHKDFDFELTLIVRRY